MTPPNTGFKFLWKLIVLHYIWWVQDLFYMHIFFLPVHTRDNCDHLTLNFLNDINVWFIIKKFKKRKYKISPKINPYLMCSIHRTTFLGFRNVICCRWRIKNVSSLAISLDFIKGSASHGSLECWGRVKKKPCKEQRRLFLKVVSGNSWNQSRWIFWLTRKIAAACQGLPHKKGQRWKFWIMFWKKSKLIGSNNHMCKTWKSFRKMQKSSQT